jgi:hypothetical protein
LRSWDTHTSSYSASRLLLLCSPLVGGDWV